MAGIWLPNGPQVEWIEYFDAATSDYNFGQVPQLETNARTVLSLCYPEGSGEGTSGVLLGQVPSGGSTNGPRFSIEHNSGSPGLQLRYGSSGTANFPARNSANGVVTYSAWNLVGFVHDGSLNGATGMRMFNGINGQPIAETAYGGAANGTGTLLNGAGNNFHIGNREDTDRTFNGSIAYLAQWNRALDPQELARAQRNGPLSVPGIALLWANGRDYGPHKLRPRSSTAIERRARPLFFAPLGLDIGRVLLFSAGATDTPIAVPAGSLALTGNAPTVTTTAHVNVAVPAGTLALTGFAPTVDNPVDVAVPAGTLALTGNAPTVTVSADRSIDVPLGTLALTGNAPTVDATADVSIDVPAGSLALTGNAPTVTNLGGDTDIDVPLGTLVMAGYAPVVLFGGGGPQPTGGWGDDAAPGGVDWWANVPARAVKAVETAAKQRTADEADTVLRKKLARADIEYDGRYGRALEALREREVRDWQALVERMQAEAPQRDLVAEQQAQREAVMRAQVAQREAAQAVMAQAIEADRLALEAHNADALKVMQMMEQEAQAQIQSAVRLLGQALKALR